jgi:hypothetical protein
MQTTKITAKTLNIIASTPGLAFVKFGEPNDNGVFAYQIHYQDGTFSSWVVVK